MGKQPDDMWMAWTCEVCGVQSYNSGHYCGWCGALAPRGQVDVVELDATLTALYEARVKGASEVPVPDSARLYAIRACQQLRRILKENGTSPRDGDTSAGVTEAWVGQTLKASAIVLLENRCNELEEARLATLAENSRLKGVIEARDLQVASAAARVKAEYEQRVKLQAELDTVAQQLRLVRAAKGLNVALTTDGQTPGQYEARCPEMWESKRCVHPSGHTGEHRVLCDLTWVGKGARAPVYCHAHCPRDSHLDGFTNGHLCVKQTGHNGLHHGTCGAEWT